MARFRVRATQEWYYEIEVDAKSASEAGTKVGDMIRADNLAPIDKVISEIDVHKVSS